MMNPLMRFKELRTNSLRPWRRGFVVTTVLAAFAFGTVQLWHADSAEWAFVLSFTGAWLLISLLWSNDDFIEETGQILASCVDRNFEAVSERLRRIESELDLGRERPVAGPDEGAG